MERIQPIRATSKRQARRSKMVGADITENCYNLRVNKRKGTKINSHITLHLQR